VSRMRQRSTCSASADSTGLSSRFRRALLDCRSLLHAAALPFGLLAILGTGQARADQIGPTAVWHGDVAADCTAGMGPNGPACLQAAMRKGGASEQAIDFARSLGFQGYLESFRNTGRIGIGTVLYPFQVNDNEQQVLLNGRPKVVDVAAAGTRLRLRTNPVLAGFVANHPNAGINDTPPHFVREMVGTDGGQRFVYVFNVSDCHACNSIAQVYVAFDFDKTGRFTEPSVIATFVPSQPATR